MRQKNLSHPPKAASPEPHRSLLGRPDNTDCNIVAQLPRLHIPPRPGPKEVSPVYLEGLGKLAVEQMRAAVRKGQLVEVADQTPPNLTISEAHRGQIDRTTIGVRWVAADDTYVPAAKGAGDPNAVTYSYCVVRRDSAWSS